MINLAQRTNIRSRLEWSRRHGHGMILACVRFIAADYPQLGWQELHGLLREMAYFGGYTPSVVRHHFEEARQ